MLRNNGFFKAWNIIYPILIYYVVSNVVMSLAIWAFGIHAGNYSENYTMLQTIAAAVAVPVLYRFYRKDQMFLTVFHQRTANARGEASKKQQWLCSVVALICGGLAGMVLNQVIGALGLAELSAGYQSVTTQFYAGNMLFEIIGLGILIPVAEEILYRGIVYARLSDWVGIVRAAIISALIFGGLHMNLVQFLYAFFIGLLLVYFMETTHSLLGAVLGHIGANVITILRTETGFLDWMNENMVRYWGTTAVMAVVCAGGVWYLWKNSQKNTIV